MKFELTAHRLREAMNDKNLKAQDVAAATNINKASISQYYNGSHKPSNIKAGILGEYLNVNPLWLMGFEVTKEPDNIPDIIDGTAEIIDLYSRATPEQRTAVLNLLRSFVLDQNSN